METAEDMASWLKHLKTTVFEVSIEQSLNDPSNEENPSIGKITDVDSAILPSSEWESCDNNNTNKTMYIRSQSDNCFLDNGKDLLIMSNINAIQTIKSTILLYR